MLAQFEKFAISKNQQKAVQGGASVTNAALNVAKTGVNLLNSTLELQQNSSSAALLEVQNVMNTYNLTIQTQTAIVKQMGNVLSSIVNNIR